MRRSRILLFALMAALVVLFTLPVVALAGGSGSDPYGGCGAGGCDGEGEPGSGSGSGGSDPSAENGSGSSLGGGSSSNSSESNSGTSSSGSDGDDLNCSDFSSQSDAQSTYVDQDGDPDNIDDDNDGSACEDFSYDDEFVEADVTDASVDEYPREGIASGGGSTAPGGPSPLPLVMSAGVFALLATGSWGFAVRRRIGR